MENLVQGWKDGSIDFQPWVAYFYDDKDDNETNEYLQEQQNLCLKQIQEYNNKGELQFNYFNITSTIDKFKKDDVSILEKFGISADPTSEDTQFELNYKIYSSILELNDDMGDDDKQQENAAIIYLFHNYIYQSWTTKGINIIRSFYEEQIKNEKGTNFLNEYVELDKDIKEQLETEVKTRHDKGETYTEILSSFQRKKISVNGKKVEIEKADRQNKKVTYQSSISDKDYKKIGEDIWQVFLNKSYLDSYFDVARKDITVARALEGEKKNQVREIFERFFKNNKEKFYNIWESNKAIMNSISRLSNEKAFRGDLGEMLVQMIQDIFFKDISSDNKYKSFISGVADRYKNNRKQQATTDVVLEINGQKIRIQSKNWQTTYMSTSAFGNKSYGLYQDNSEDVFGQELLLRWRYLVANQNSIFPENKKYLDYLNFLILPALSIQNLQVYGEGSYLSGNDLFAFEGTYFTRSFLAKLALDNIDQFANLKVKPNISTSDKGRINIWNSQTQLKKDMPSAYNEYCNICSLEKNSGKEFGDIKINITGFYNLQELIYDTLLLLSSRISSNVPEGQLKPREKKFNKLMFASKK